MSSTTPQDTLDVEQLRAATPGCTDLAFFGNAGSSLPTSAVLDSSISYLRREAVLGGYAAADEVAGLIDESRATAARLIGAGGPSEISLQHSDTTAFVKIFTGMCNAGLIPRGARIVVDRLAYSSHYLGVLQAAKTIGVSIDVLPSNPDGSLDVDRIAATLDRPTALVSATMVATHCGLVNPVAALGTVCNERGIPFILDACQAFGQLPVDVEQIGCDALTTTGRKWLRAPRGTGFLYVREALAERCEPFGIDGHSADWLSATSYALKPGAGRFDEFEYSAAARVGFATAVSELENLTVERVALRLRGLSGHLRSGLADAGADVLDGDGPKSAIVTFSVRDVDPAEIVRQAAANRIAISSSGVAGARLDMDAKGFSSVVRAAPHIYNTTEEIDRLVSVVRQMTTTRRQP